MQTPKLILATRSPRRAKLLTSANYTFTQINPPYQDPPHPAPGDPQSIARTTAERKAASVLAALNATQPRPAPSLILAADTIAVADDGTLIGTPESPDQAEHMLRRFIDRTHTVLTAVALVPTYDQPSQIFDDSATVTFGQIDRPDLDAYLQTGSWPGKAGAYNLEERLNAGWPIQVKGDPATVMGLPMRFLRDRLATFLITPQIPASS